MRAFVHKDICATTVANHLFGTVPEQRRVFLNLAEDTTATNNTPWA